MSRIGRKPIALPQGVTVEIKEGLIVVKGAKEQLSTPMMNHISVKVQDGQVQVSRDNDEKATRAAHGMIRAMINNMVTGVTTGYTRELEIIGVGYRAQMQGSKLVLNLGYSHPIEVDPPKGISFACDGPNNIAVKGADKQAVGQCAAIIRGYRPPEPYKGKGIRYKGEHIIRKAGKSGTK